MANERWDVFCRVVDNLGDVGVSWRLARALAVEHGKAVRLWLDDFTVLAKLRPELDARYDVQRLEGVEVVKLAEPFTVDTVADVVVETFGCDLPAAYIAAMAARPSRPRWINLEYLSAEDWVEGSHGLPSPDPRLPLVKHYFFPGFSARTGGLLRERDLVERRDLFQSDEGAQAAFWKGLLGKAPPRGALKVSLFSYAGAPLDALARACAQHAGAVWLIAPEGAAATALQEWTRRRWPPRDRGLYATLPPAGPLRPPALGVRRELRARGGFLRARAVGGQAVRVEHLPDGRWRALGEDGGVPRALYPRPRCACGGERGGAVEGVEPPAR
jgi:uncharacterized repeat protein (TIGR03837 family)